MNSKKSSVLGLFARLSVLVVAGGIGFTVAGWSTEAKSEEVGTPATCEEGCTHSTSTSQGDDPRHTVVCQIETCRRLEYRTDDGGNTEQYCDSQTYESCQTYTDY
jgi:hypothetical protein